MLTKKTNISLVSLISIIILFFIIYKLIYYTPPLLDYSKRNIIEKTIDFFGFSWHLYKSALYKVFLRKDISKKEYAKAVWYRIDYFPKLINIDNKDLLLIAEMYRENKLNHQVKELYSYFLKKEINDLRLLKNIEAFFLEREDWKYTKKAGEKILKLDPKDLNTHYYIGLSCLRLNEFEKSEKYFKRLVSSEPDFADVYYRLGLIALRNKNYEEAQKLFEKTVEILPNHYEALLHLK